MSLYSSRVLRSLAPYFPLDLIFDLVARYPRTGLLEEIKDPKGRIWTERTLIELQEPPVVLGDYGTRAYNLWVTLQLSPWGTIRLGENFQEIHDTGISARWVWGIHRYLEKYRKTIISIWAWREEGLKFCSVVARGKANLKKILRGVQNEKNWELASPGPFLSLIGHKDYCLGLLRNGEVWKYSSRGLESENLTLSQNFPLFRYIRSYALKILYALDHQGRHIHIRLHMDRWLLYLGQSGLTPNRGRQSHYPTGAIELFTFEPGKVEETLKLWAQQGNSYQGSNVLEVFPQKEKKKIRLPQKDLLYLIPNYGSKIPPHREVCDDFNETLVTLGGQIYSHEVNKTIYEGPLRFWSLTREFKEESFVGLTW